MAPTLISIIVRRHLSMQIQSCYALHLVIDRLMYFIESILSLLNFSYLTFSQLLPLIIGGVDMASCEWSSETAIVIYLDHISISLTIIPACLHSLL